MIRTKRVLQKYRKRRSSSHQYLHHRLQKFQKKRWIFQRTTPGAFLVLQKSIKDSFFIISLKKSMKSFVLPIKKRMSYHQKETSAWGYRTKYIDFRYHATVSISNRGIMTSDKLCGNQGQGGSILSNYSCFIRQIHTSKPKYWNSQTLGSLGQLNLYLLWPCEVINSKVVQIDKWRQLVEHIVWLFKETYDTIFLAKVEFNQQAINSKSTNKHAIASALGPHKAMKAYCHK